MRGITRPGVPRLHAKSFGVSLFAAALAVPALVVSQSGAVGAAPALAGARASRSGR